MVDKPELGAATGAGDLRTSRQRRRDASELHSRWATEVQQALQERGLSVYAAARQAGITPGALQAWLKGSDPDPRALGRLARVIGRRHLYLQQLLGWLPQELSDVPLRLEAGEKLQDSIAQASRWVEAATAVIGFSGPLLIADELLRNSEEWQVTIRHSIRGHLYEVPFSTYAAFSRLGPPGRRHQRSTVPSATNDDRREIEQLTLRAFQSTSPYWREPATTEHMQWAERHDLVLVVPRLLATTPRGLRPNQAVPPSILVVGVPYAGAINVGALLATVLDWGSVDLEMAAGEWTGIQERTERTEPVVTHARSDVARRLLKDPEDGARFLVWAWTDIRSILRTFRRLELEAFPDRAEPRIALPLVVFIKVPDTLFEYVAERDARDPSQRGGLLDAELVAAAQSLIEVHLAKRDPTSYKVLELTPPQDALEIPPADRSVDLFFDQYVQLAFEAAQWLQQVHGGPRLNEAPGILAQLWRRGPKSDPR